MEQERLKMYQLLHGDGITELGFSAFVSKYFATEAKTKELHDYLISKKSPRGNYYYSNPVGDFFKKYACDLFPNSTYCGGSGTSSSTGENIFACLLKDPDLRLTPDKKAVVFNGSDGKWTFFSNHRFHTTIGKLMGNWTCDGTDNYIIMQEDGWNYSSKTNDWTRATESSSSSSSSNSSSGTSLVDTNLTANDLAAGKTVKVGMKGNIVGDIQQLLIDKGFVHVSKNDTVDYIFGNRTKRMVQAFQAANGLADDGVVGKDTWAKLNGNTASNNSSTSQATSVKSPDEVAGSDSVIIQENRKKILRKYLQEFK